MKIGNIELPFDEKHPYLSGVLFGIVCQASAQLLIYIFAG